jgi:hypothetical protein
MKYHKTEDGELESKTLSVTQREGLKWRRKETSRPVKLMEDSEEHQQRGVHRD